MGPHKNAETLPSPNDPPALCSLCSLCSLWLNWFPGFLTTNNANEHEFEKEPQTTDGSAEALFQCGSRNVDCGISEQEPTTIKKLKC
jgi:hypothetical protein